jgi:peptidase E
MSDRHIVAMGGGGFSHGPDSHALDDYLLGLTGKDRPKVCFVPTASGDSDAYIVRFYQAFPVTKCVPCHLPLFRRTSIDLYTFLLEQDMIYVGGGNTANMLALWRVHGVDVVLREAWDAGVLLCGTSAGSLCWFESGTTDSFGPDLTPLRDGLRFVPGSHSPHYDDGEQRRSAYHRFVAEGLLPGGFAAESGVGLHFIGTALAEVVTSHEGKRAYRVERVGDEVQETPIDSRLLH